MGWAGKILEQGPQGGEQRIEGEENSNWNLYANPTEHKSWPGLDPCGRAPLAALSPADSRPPSAPLRPPNTLHCPQPDHKPHMSCVPFTLA